jgi:hypothetical protein
LSKAKAFFLEAVQFVPVITLASSFIVGGGVDLNRAASLFVISAIGALLITATLAAKKVSLNPILLGTNLWLCMGALAFGIPIAPFATVIGTVQAFGLYVCVFAVGTALIAAAPTGFIGMGHPNRRLVRKLSFILLAITAVALLWSFLFMDNIRLGGALPFIVLNVSRRMMMRRNRPAQVLDGPAG